MVLSNVCYFNVCCASIPKDCCLNRIFCSTPTSGPGPVWRGGGFFWGGSAGQATGYRCTTFHQLVNHFPMNMAILTGWAMFGHSWSIFLVLNFWLVANGSTSIWPYLGEYGHLLMFSRVQFECRGVIDHRKLPKLMGFPVDRFIRQPRFSTPFGFIFKCITVLKCTCSTVVFGPSIIFMIRFRLFMEASQRLIFCGSTPTSAALPVTEWI